MQQYQGDILILKIDKLPQGLELKQTKKNVIVEEGEVSGHFHKLQVVERSKSTVKMIEKDNGFYFQIEDESVELTHPEHPTITFEPGYYWVGKQYEYDEIEELKQVRD